MESRSEGRRLTASEFALLPDTERRDELEAGWLVSEPLPSLLHNQVRRRLERILDAAVARHHLGEVFGKAGFVLARNPDTVRGPDLAIEVLSPSNRPYQVRAKVADPARRSVTTYRTVLDPRVLGADDVLACEDLIPGLSLRAGSIFESDLNG